MCKNLIIVLGHENNEKGKLSSTAENRAITASKIAKEELREYKIIPTGGFGDYFNESSTPHGKILANRIEKEGINKENILSHTNTSGTKQDAYLSLKRIKEIGEAEKVYIVTSKFHMDRVKLIFSRVLQEYDLIFRESPNPSFESEVIKEKIEHEKKRIKEFKKNWVNVAGFDLDKCSSEIHSDLLEELQHYDRYSYLALAGAFFSTSFGLSWVSVGENPIAASVTSVLMILLVALFGLLYYRLARTAKFARRALEAVELIYGHPGISWTNLKGVPEVADWSDPSVGKIVVTILCVMALGLLANAIAPWICDGFLLEQLGPICTW